MNSNKPGDSGKPVTDSAGSVSAPSLTPNDRQAGVGRLGAGQSVSRDLFFAILDDPKALAMLTDQIRLRDALAPPVCVPDLNATNGPVIQLASCETPVAAEVGSGSAPDVTGVTPSPGTPAGTAPAWSAETVVAGLRFELKTLVSETFREYLSDVKRAAEPPPSDRTSARRWLDNIPATVLAASIAFALLVLLTGASTVAAFNQNHKVNEVRELLASEKQLHAGKVENIQKLLAEEKQCRQEFEGKLAGALEELKKRGHAVQLVPVTPDLLQRELEQAQEFTLAKSDKPNKVVIQLSPYLGATDFAALQVDWGDGKGIEWVYRRDDKQLRLSPQIEHEYALPGPENPRPVTVKLVYRLTGAGMKKFNKESDQLPAKTLSLVSTSRGIRPLESGAENSVLATITEPARDGARVSRQFMFEMKLELPGSGEVSPEDRIVHILVRPLTGPGSRSYTVQPFSQRRSGLLNVGGAAHLRTWVTLPSGTPLGTEYEILIVELSAQLREQEVSMELMDFGPEPRKNKVVLDMRIVRFE
jgi:hypothetical protein